MRRCAPSFPLGKNEGLASPRAELAGPCALWGANSKLRLWGSGKPRDPSAPPKQRGRRRRRRGRGGGFPSGEPKGTEALLGAWAPRQPPVSSPSASPHCTPACSRRPSSPALAPVPRRVGRGERQATEELEGLCSLPGFRASGYFAFPGSQSSGSSLIPEQQEGETSASAL